MQVAERKATNVAAEGEKLIVCITPVASVAEAFVMVTAEAGSLRAHAMVAWSCPRVSLVTTMGLRLTTFNAALIGGGGEREACCEGVTVADSEFCIGDEVVLGVWVGV